MNKSQAPMLQSLRAVERFLDIHAPLLGNVPETGARQDLADMVTQLAAHVATQSASAINAQSSTQRQRELRDEVVNGHMAPIARIAASKLPNTPALKPLRMPKGEPGVEKLAAHARGMGEAASQHAAVFVAAGLPVDFVAQLNATVDAMLGAVQSRTQSKGALTGATSGLKITLAQARKVVGVLDVFVKRALKDNPSLLANWNTVQRVQLTGTARTASETEEPASPADVTTGVEAAPGPSTAAEQAA
jgi:hypothetical protein